MQIKTILKYHHTTVRMATTNRQKMCVSEHMEKMDHFTVGDSVN